MQFARFIYISRKWERDEVRIAKQVEYLGKHSADQPYQLVLFPEGTNLTPSAKEKSRLFGEKNNLKPLNYLLQPRTTGFTYLVQQMRQRKLMFRSSHFSFLVIFGNEVTKILRNHCLHFARQDGQEGKNRKENHTNKVTKIQKTKR